MAEDWTIVASETEYETGWYTGGYDLVEQPDGSRKRYYWAALAPAVVVVAIDSPPVRAAVVDAVPPGSQQRDGPAVWPVLTRFADHPGVQDP